MRAGGPTFQSRKHAEGVVGRTQEGGAAGLGWGGLGAGLSESQLCSAVGCVASCGPVWPGSSSQGLSKTENVEAFCEL